jgi:hypothetical protein
LRWGGSAGEFPGLLTATAPLGEPKQFALFGRQRFQPLEMTRRDSRAQNDLQGRAPAKDADSSRQQFLSFFRPFVLSVRCMAEEQFDLSNCGQHVIYIIIAKVVWVHELSRSQRPHCFARLGF